MPTWANARIRILAFAAIFFWRAPRLVCSSASSHISQILGMISALIPCATVPRTVRYLTVMDCRSSKYLEIKGLMLENDKKWGSSAEKP